MDKNEIVLFETEDKEIKLEVPVEQDTVWLTQAQMTELFSVDRTVITRHVNNVFREGELERESNVQKMHIANSDKPVQLYNLDVIISVGYRIKSKRGVEFRRWANKVLKNYILEGYAINNKRLEELIKWIEEMPSYYDGESQIFVHAGIDEEAGEYWIGQAASSGM